MSKRTKTILIVIAVVIAAYIAYRWWTNRQSNADNSQSLGANLNSAAPELVGGSSGPDSGLNYNPGTTIIDIPNPDGSTNTNGQQPPPQEGTPIKQKKPGNPVHAKSPVHAVKKPAKKPVRDGGPAKK